MSSEIPVLTIDPQLRFEISDTPHWLNWLVDVEAV
jgi:hypothetical protein